MNIDYGNKWDKFWYNHLHQIVKGKTNRNKKEEWLGVQNRDIVNYNDIEEELIIDKIVVEIGCGIGRIAKGIALSCKKYYGFDISNFAILICNIIAPYNTKFIQISKDSIKEYKDILKNKVDTVVIKEVFIHLGESLVREYLKFTVTILQKEGIIYTNFYYKPNVKIGKNGVVSKKVIETEGAVVLYTEKTIREIFDDCNLNIIALKYKNERYFVKAKRI